MANWSKMFEGLAETTGDYFDALSKENKSKRDAKIASTKLDEAREYSKGLREEARIYNEGKTTETREYNKGLLETARIRQEEDRKEQRTYAAKLLEDKNKRADEKESARQESSKNKAEIAQRKQKLLIQGKAVALAEDIRKGIEDGEDQTSAIDLLNQYETELKLPLSRLGTETVAGEEHWYGNEDDTEKTVLIQGVGSQQDRPPLSSFRK